MLPDFHFVGLGERRKEESRELATCSFVERKLTSSLLSFLQSLQGRSREARQGVPRACEGDVREPQGGCSRGVWNRRRGSSSRLPFFPSSFRALFELGGLSPADHCSLLPLSASQSHQVLRRRVQDPSTLVTLVQGPHRMSHRRRPRLPDLEDHRVPLHQGLLPSRHGGQYI